MKKLVLTAIVALALAATSCGSKTSEQVSASDMKTKIENCTNPDSLKVYVDQAKDYAKKLVDEGKVDEAQKYLDQIEPVVKDKAPALSSTFDAVNTALGKVKDVAGDKFDDAKEAASVAGDSVSSAASNAVEGVKEAAPHFSKDHPLPGPVYPRRLDQALRQIAEVSVDQKHRERRENSGQNNRAMGI